MHSGPLGYINPANQIPGVQIGHTPGSFAPIDTIIIHVIKKFTDRHWNNEVNSLGVQYRHIEPLDLLIRMQLKGYVHLEAILAPLWGQKNENCFSQVSSY